MPVIDASVYIASINPHEVAHQRSLAWLQQAQANQAEIVAPVIIMAEVGAALSRGLGNPLLAHQVVQQLRNSALVTLKLVTADLSQRAAQIAIDHQIRGCDAIYVALAQELNDELITLDQQQLQRGANVVTTKQP